jgi:hypothetical protein
MPRDWERHYGHRPLLLETLVDSSRFRGTCYCAANWLHVGQTAGRGRMDREQKVHGQDIKDIYLYPQPKYSNALMGCGLLRWSLKPNISNVARLLAFVTGLVNQELLLKNEYLLVENRILKARLQPGLRLSGPERTALAEIGKRLGRKLLQQVASVANPDTILGWYRQLVAAKFDGSRQRGLPGRPRIAAEIERLVVRLARENSSWGYDRMVGALAKLANLGHTVSDQTVGNILRRPGIAPARERKRTTTWSQFIGSHMAVLAGTDFFTVEVLTWRGLVTYYTMYSSFSTWRRDG